MNIKWNVKQCGIYCIRNKISKKRYIGSSVNCYHRIKSQHLARLRIGTHNNPHLQSSFSKYGESAFEYFIIELCEEKNMLSKEQHHIDKMKSMDSRFGYNINTQTNKIVLTAEQCEKIRLSKLGKKRSNKRHVGIYKSGKNWAVKIGMYGEELYLGSFSDKRDAARVYEDALELVKKGQKPDMSLFDKLRISNNKPVLQRRRDTNKVRWHESARAASRSTGISLGAILRCCHGKCKKPRGPFWSFSC